MALPALRELRRIFAEDHLTLVARPGVSGLFDGEELADELFLLQDSSGFLDSCSSFVAQARRLRRERFELGVLLQNAFGAALLARASGVRRVAGYPTDGRRLLLDHVIPFEVGRASRNHVFYYLNVASQLERALKGRSDVDLDNAQPRLTATGQGRIRAVQLLEDVETAATLPPPERSSGPQPGPGPASGSPVVALNPGATNSRAKRWPAERFAATADLLAERDGFRTVIVGSAGDVEAARQTAENMRTRAGILAGRTTIAELKALLASVSLVVSNDTGAAHVSAALGVPTVVIFGPTDDVATRPLSDQAIVVRHDVECSPCMLRDCPIDHRCMTRVEVREVYRAAKRLLTSGRPASRRLGSH
jgi:lipopolysaccharide heptosyltransferase II